MRSWGPVIVAVVVACAAFAFAFRPEIVGAVKVWTDSTAYNHCFLVLPLVGALLWSRRRSIVELHPRPSPWLLTLVLPVGGLWLLAALLDVLEAEQLLVVAMFEVLLLAVLGWQVFRALLAPLLFIFFLVPFGAFLVPLLQRFTAAFAVDGLRLLGIPVFADGFMIQIPEGRFEVAEACAGLRFLIASIVFGCFFAAIVYRGPMRRAIFIGLSIAVPIVANGLRALGLLVLAHLEGSAAAVETDHVLYGWLFFSLVTFLLIALGMLFADRPQPLPAPRARDEAASMARVGGTMAAGLLLALLPPAYLAAVSRAAAAPVLSAQTSSLAGDGWVREADAKSDWHPVLHGAASQSFDVYRNGDASVAQLVALYPLPARGSPFTKAAGSLADPDAWRIAETGRKTLTAGGTTLTVNTALLERQSRHRLVWWYYALDGDTTPSTLEAKLLQARTAFAGGPHVGAFVAIATPADDLMSAEGTLARFLEATGPRREISRSPATGSKPDAHR